MSSFFHAVLCVLVLLLALVSPTRALRAEPAQRQVNISSDTHTFQYYAQYETTDDFSIVTTTVRFNADEDTFGINFDETFGPLVATAEVRAMQYQNGWDEVQVRLEPSFYRISDSISTAERVDIAYAAAGIAEGFATFAQMEAHLSNVWDGPQGLGHLIELPAVQDWVEEQVEFLVELADDTASGPYGRQLGRLLSLLLGVVHGYNVHQEAETVSVSSHRGHNFRVRAADARRPSAAFGAAADDDAPPLRLLDFATLFVLNAQAEIGDIVKAVHLQHKVTPEQTDGRAQTAAEALAALTQRFPHFLGDLHCSALVKVVPDEDLFVSHVTWNSFESMTRQHKTYLLEDASLDEASRTADGKDNATLLRKSVTMSGYPGLLSSVDDWYQTHQRLVVTETTFGVYNTSLFEAYLQPRAVPTFLRALLASYLSTSLPSSWLDIFGRHNSGTYNNQWMVLSMAALSSRPRKNAPLPENTFWVGEQLPAPAPASTQDGHVYNPTSYGLTSADLSAHLSKAGYWASYNLPFFPCVDESSGTAARRAEVGRLYSYNETPRARIFAREQASVRTLTDMMALMRMNHFTTDVESLIPNCTGTVFGSCDPPYSAFLAIASRGDLNPSGGPERYGPSYASLGRRNHGATDAKITSWANMMAAAAAKDKGAGDTVYVSYVVNAPTTSGGTLPPFRWRSGLFALMPSVWGLPTYQRDVFVRMVSPGPPRAAGLSPDKHYYTGYIVAAVCGVVFVVAMGCVVAKARQARQYAVPRRERGEVAAPLLG